MMWRYEDESKYLEELREEVWHYIISKYQEEEQSQEEEA